MHTERPVSRRAFLGAAVATTAASTGSVSAQEGEATATPGDGGGTTHTVDMTDDLVFEPEEITIAPGDTVEWVNVGTLGHSVTAYEDELPDGAAYFASGGFDAEQAARDAYPDGDIPGGETYEHTFETAGEHGYFCIPHEAAGMVGTVVVQEGGGDGGDGGGGVQPAIGDAAKSIGLAAVVAMVTTLLLAFVFLKYGGEAA